MKKLILPLLLLAGLFIGCSSNPPSNNPIENPEVTIPAEIEQFVPNETNVKALGRTYFNKDYLWLGYTDTGVEFNVSASYLEVTIRGDSTSASGKDNGNNARIVAFLDGERIFDQLIISPQDSYTIFNKEETVNGVVRIIKVSEATSSIAAIKSIGVDKGGSISPAAKKDLKIEFIGDSITCGYGVDDTNASNHFATRTEDGSKTYAYKTAQALDADYSMVSVSGSGIISCYSGDGKRNTWALHPDFYEKTCISSTSAGGTSMRTLDWDFSSFIPDVIVINLGTNDSSYTKGDKSKQEEFTAEYAAFLKQVRAKNLDAKIVCTLGLMGADLYPAIEAAVQTVKTETGDTKLYSLKFANQNSADGIGADWHPSEKTHQKAAKVLTAYIQGL